MRKLYLGGLVVVILVLAALLISWFYNQGEASKQTYKIEPVQKGNILALVSSTGTLTALNTVSIGSQVSGNIKEIHVDFNSPVKKDDVLALIDPAVYTAQAAQAKAQLLKARMTLLEKEKDIHAARAAVGSAAASLNSAKATLHEAELKFHRFSSLVEKKTVAKSEYDAALVKRDNARSAVEVAGAKLKTARAQLESMIAQEKGARASIDEKEAALQLAEVKLDYCTIRSPIDGIVIYRAADVGQTVAASLQSPVLFHIAEDLTRMQVEVDVSEADVGQIKPDQKVEFTVDAYPDRKFQATVRQVRYFSQNVQNVVTYKMIAEVNNPQLLLRPGMTANVNVVVAQETGVLKVPNAALRFRPLGEIQEEKKPKARPPVEERPLYKETVKILELDSDQAGQYLSIIKAAEAKLRDQLQSAQEDSDRKMAWQTYLRQIYGQLRPILRPEQLKKFRAFNQERRAALTERRKKGGRPGQVYVLDENGLPNEVKVITGVTNETETEILEGRLKEGDGVITGLVFNIKSDKNNSSPSSFLRMFGRGR